MFFALQGSRIGVCNIVGSNLLLPFSHGLSRGYPNIISYSLLHPPRLLPRPSGERERRSLVDQSLPHFGQKPAPCHHSTLTGY